MLAIAVLFLGSAGLCAQTPEDLNQGKKLYQGHCSPCHGQTGTGGRGPNLAQPRLKHGSSEEAIADVIKNGIAGTEMPGAWQLSEREVNLVAAFVRSLGRVEKVDLPGDAAAGRRTFEGSGCGQCHIVNGEGVAMGPELTEIGVRRNAEYLREAMVRPGAAVPEGYLYVEITTVAGRRVSGQRVNEDSFTIQIQDASGRYHSFRKAEIKDLRKLAGRSSMPSYQGKLSEAELDNLIAYLASLRGEP
jgi:putative heme-binding domain-containing protein